MIYKFIFLIQKSPQIQVQIMESDREKYSAMPHGILHFASLPLLWARQNVQNDRVKHYYRKFEPLTLFCCLHYAINIAKELY